MRSEVMGWHIVLFGDFGKGHKASDLHLTICFMVRIMRDVFGASSASGVARRQLSGASSFHLLDIRSYGEWNDKKKQ